MEDDFADRVEMSGAKIVAAVRGNAGGRITHPRSGWVRVVVEGQVASQPQPLKPWKDGFAAWLPTLAVQAGQTLQVQFSKTEGFERFESIFPAN